MRAHAEIGLQRREGADRIPHAEAQRRFTEAIIDSLPLSLYAVDRNYRIVAWNRNRELGGQGIPRRAVMGRNIFEVLTRQRREILEREFARAFETGEIERIEQETNLVIDMRDRAVVAPVGPLHPLAVQSEPTVTQRQRP